MTAAGGYSANAGQVAQVFIQEASSEHESNFIISYPDDAGLLARFNGSFKHHHERPGDDWAFADGWRVVEFDQQTVSGWGYNSLRPIDEDEPDPQRKVRLLLTNHVIGRVPVIVSDTAGGGVVPRNDGNTYMVWRRQGPSATVHDAVRQVFFTGFDTPLQSLVTNGNVVAIATQNAYTQEPPYRGPNPDYPPPADVLNPLDYAPPEYPRLEATDSHTTRREKEQLPLVAAGADDRGAPGRDRAGGRPCL